MLVPEDFKSRANPTTFNVNYHAHASVTGLKSSTYTIGIEVTPKRLSIFNFPRGSNNDAEAFHSRFKIIVLFASTSPTCSLYYYV